MPTYSYRCTECGTAFDIQQAFTDDSLTECPTCGGRLRKLFNSVGVTFNGSGFYRTDSRPAEKSEKSGEKSGDKPSEKKAEKKAESAPAPASSPAPAASASKES
jgi:putative FmdB family regulatory protein